MADGARMGRLGFAAIVVAILALLVLDGMPGVVAAAALELDGDDC